MKVNSPIVIDSSALISLFSPHDSNHQAAKKIGSSLKQSMILPGEIFTETINVLGKKTNHNIAIRYGLFILKSEYNVIETNDQIRKIAFDKFQKQSESVSFTDCVVMAVADHFETKSIFGFDEAFHKNGYTRVGIDDV